MNRTKRFQELLVTRFNGKQADFARAIGRTPAMIYQWKDGRRVIGDAVARHIEVTLGLPQSWFDSTEAVPPLPHKAQPDSLPTPQLERAPSPMALALADLFDQLPHDSVRNMAWNDACDVLISYLSKSAAPARSAPAPKVIAATQFATTPVRTSPGTTPAPSASAPATQ